MKDMRPDRDVRHITALLRRQQAGGADDLVRRAGGLTRRRHNVVAVGVAAVALAVVIGPHLVDGTRISSVAARAARDANPAGSGLEGLAHPYTCPAPGQPDARASVPAHGSVPPDAVLAQLCPVRRPGASGSVAQRGPVTADVGALGALVNALPRAPRWDAPCPATLDQNAFTVTFQYADGSLVRVLGLTGGCDRITVVGGPVAVRVGADRLLSAYLYASRGG